jgi:hypothetical protein
VPAVLANSPGVLEQALAARAADTSTGHRCLLLVRRPLLCSRLYKFNRLTIVMLLSNYAIIARLRVTTVKIPVRVTSQLLIALTGLLIKVAYLQSQIVTATSNPTNRKPSTPATLPPPPLRPALLIAQKIRYLFWLEFV